MKTMFLFLVMMGTAGLGAAQEPVGADGQLPPALRNRPATPPPAAGAALRAQALAKLETQFREADRDHNGSLTVEEAKNFGFVARHFEAIDSARRGAVSFEELRAYLERTKAGRR
ncbi:EF-hand domain-containing protein [Halobellus sp. Atlit-31R]|nr:EF-hand domain-containing protein [Halobellus sp. Atlit-31R]